MTILLIIALSLTFWVLIGVYALLVHTQYFAGMNNLASLEPYELLLDFMRLFYGMLSWPQHLINYDGDDSDSGDSDSGDEQYDG